MQCSCCGKNVPLGSRFCPSCGSAVPVHSMVFQTGTALPSVPPSISQIAPPERGTRINGCGCVVAIIIFIAVVVSLAVNSGQKSKDGDMAPSEKVEQPYKAPILSAAIPKYPESEKELKKAGFSKTLKKLGLENIKKCNRLFPLAAEKAARNKNCDAVMMVDISDKSTKDNIVIFVTAQNYTKFYFTEEELLNDGAALSEQEKLAPLLWRHEVMAEEVIKSHLHHPSTYDRHELGVFQSRTTPSCNEIMIEFSAKNSFGVELTYIAVVQFDKDSNVVGFNLQEK
ncbi:MAG: zinc ribbon domain-containing protein [Akkermansia sp.]|nr:zinc ribbon domain-containing protein [Akkermansia sp.]